MHKMHKSTNGDLCILWNFEKTRKFYVAFVIYCHIYMENIKSITINNDTNLLYKRIIF